MEYESAPVVNGIGIKSSSFETLVAEIVSYFGKFMRVALLFLMLIGQLSDGQLRRCECVFQPV